MASRCKRRNTLQSVLIVSAAVLLALRVEDFLYAFVSHPSQHIRPSSSWRSSSHKGSTGIAASRTASGDSVVSDDQLESVIKRKMQGNSDAADDEDVPDEAESGLSESAKKALETVRQGTRGQKRQAVKKIKKSGQSKQIVKRSLDEILKSANDDDERPSYLPAKRDIYKEVGITHTEVESYWKNAGQSSRAVTSKGLTFLYVFGFFALCGLAFNVYDSIVNPQEFVVASPTGTA
eukprot:TRINITY_DN41149_c0_g1_i1.p1 TRINITY_DN41149_c0_g1~~TRINITY_DN41149_c0_g1_i1.p1  ORF type:complete len:235 (-),score=24.77 TRINITY_DN41149_c0_g1_i1:549-1253(-)